MSARLASRNLRAKRSLAFGAHAVRTTTPGMSFAEARRFTIDCLLAYQARQARGQQA